MYLCLRELNEQLLVDALRLQIRIALGPLVERVTVEDVVRVEMISVGVF